MSRIFRLLAVALLFVSGIAVFDAATLVEDAHAQALPGGSSASGANVSMTRHNLSPSAPSRQQTSGNTATPEPILASTSTSEVCVYCHTPHAAESGAQKPLWNRKDSVATYTPYTSSSLNATDLDMSTLATPSKLCMSCHDGTIAIGSVTNAPGSGLGSPISFDDANFGTYPSPAVGGNRTMPYGRNQNNADHGFTRRLGTDMRNDHPIAFTYDANLAQADGELRNPATSNTPTKIANRGGSGAKPDFPLTNGKVQCSTCHDPHRNTQKFLLKNRLATGVPTPQTAWDNWTFNSGDQICLGCHTRLGKTWQQSAHADPQAANETYKTGPGALRDFPTGTQVWQAGCLNCHDTHAVAGSRRLLREGVSGALITLTPADLGYSAQMRTGDPSVESLNTKSATENTCYQCHSDGLSGRPVPVINTPGLTANEGVPNVAAEFARPYHMPITNADQGSAFAGNNVEKHEVTDNTGMETQIGLGYGVPANRHVECTDCHNPHRVVKADTFLGPNLPGGDTTRRTHVLARGVNGEYGNIASGVLRGAWGVEPSYTSAAQTTVTTTSAWLSPQENPTFTVKKGDPGGASTLPIGSVGTNAAPYLTREYQLCFKCHSSYANGPFDTDFPLLKPDNTRGGTPSTGAALNPTRTLANKMTRYTNVAAEFAVLATDPPTTGTHQGEVTNVGSKCGGGDCAPIGMTVAGNTGGNGTPQNNHRAWHPVVFPTGRDKAERTMTATLTNIRAPWDQKMGSQTMHCTDCHGNPASYTVTTNPNAGGQTLNAVQGPHGSEQPYLLKGRWDTTLSLNGTYTDTDYLCIKCHQPRVGDNSSGYGSDHVMGENMTVACMFCHVAVPHGWKNKAFLVNGLCVGIEGKTDNSGNPITSGCVSFGNDMDTVINREPYYIGSRLRVSDWPRSGGWGASSCNGQGNMCGA